MKTQMKTKKTVLFLPLLCVTLIFTFCLSLVFVSCNPKQEEDTSSTSFRRIFDKPQLASYRALDIKVAPDGGYIILGKSGTTPYLLRIDQSGHFMWDTDSSVLTDYKEPVADLVLLGADNKTYSFFCNKNTENGWITVLLKFHEAGGQLVNRVPEEYPLTLKNYAAVDAIQPLNATRIGSGRLLLSASDQSWKNILLIRTGSNGVSAGEDVHNVSAHCSFIYPPANPMFHIGGTIDGRDEYFFQTYLDTAATRNIPADTSNPAAYDDFMCLYTGAAAASTGDVAAEYPLATPFLSLKWHFDQTLGYTFSGVRADNDDILQFFINIPLAYADVVDGMVGTQFESSKPVLIEMMDVDGRKVIWFGCTSKNLQMTIIALDFEEREYLGNFLFDSLNTSDMVRLLPTEDGGMVLLSNNIIENRLNRIGMIKLSKAEVYDILNF